MLRGLSLQFRLMLLVLAALLPVALLSVWFGLREIENSTQLARTQLRLAASLVAAHQDRSIESAQTLLRAIASMPGMATPQRGSCEPYFERLRELQPTYSNIGVLDLEGDVVCHASGRVGDFNAGDRPYFLQALQDRRFVVGELIAEGRVSGRAALPVALPLADAGNVTGVVFAALDVQHGSRALGSLHLPEGARVIVADRGGRILLEYPQRAGSPTGRLLANPRIRAMAQQMADGSGEADDNEGQPRLFAAAAGRELGGQRFFALVSLPRDQITSASWSRLRDELAVLGLTLAAGLALAWWVAARTVVKPAKQILGAVRRLEQGVLDARVPLLQQQPRGEFARIAAAFNLMADALQARQRDLEAELGRSRGAYRVLDTILNSMQEGLLAVDHAGRVLMHNGAAAALFPLENLHAPAERWPVVFGLFDPGAQRPLEAQDMPFARAVRGESGDMLVLVRNAQVPVGRILRCVYQPVHGDAGLSGGLVMLVDVTELEKAESDLVLLRNAVARLNDVVLITEAEPIDEPGPRIVFVNEAFERLTGYSSREALGRSPRLLQGPGTDGAALARIREALVQRRPVREELLNYAKDGRPIWLETDIVPLANEQGRFTHFIAVQRDVTGRRAFEDALLASERELQDYNRMLQHAADAAQAITRHRQLDATLREVVEQARSVIGAHMAVLSLTGEGGWEQAVVAASFSERYAAWRDYQDAPRGEGIYTRALADGKPLRLTHAQLLAHPDWKNYSGEQDRHPPLRGLLAVPLVAGNGRCIGLLQLSDRDVGEFTDRDEYVAIEIAQLASIAIENARLFEQIRELNAGLESRIVERTAELSRQEKRFRALADQAPEIVWNVDPAGRLTYLNRAWYELVGGEPPQWLGDEWVQRIHPDDLGPMRERWRHSRTTLEPYTGTRRVLARDGSWHTMSFRGVPVLDETGQLVFWVGIDADITELKAIEQALRDSNQELEAFSYSVSHDLRAPLGAIGGFSQALSARLQGVADDKSLHYLARIQAGVVKMEQLIEALLGLSRVARAPLRRASVDLGAIARETLEGLHVQEPARRVRTVVEDGLAAQGDAALLRVLMENLLGNAWKFSSRNDEAVIEVGRDAEGAFYVRDNGVGFDMAYAQKLFSTFQRLHTEAEFPGTGIGLATVRRIVTRHQGRVWAESEPGRGTTIRFTLGVAIPGFAADA